VWVTRTARIFAAGDGHLIKLGDPATVRWFAQGREATRAEVEASIEGGYPALLQLAEAEGADAVAELAALRRQAIAYLPEPEAMLP
jgi:hypothetical protein